MSDVFIEIAKFTGKACGTIVKDLADISQPLTEAFRGGWRDAMGDKPKTEHASPSSDRAPESA